MGDCKVMDRYKVVHLLCGDRWLYGYAHTPEGAEDLLEKCKEEGWIHCWIEQWNEDEEVWEASRQGGNWIGSEMQ